MFKRERVAPTKPTPGQTDAWVMLGYLLGAIEDARVITVADWNGAVQTADAAAQRIALRVANHANRSGAEG